jgi:tetratricopeptide (TPR) repeat protein
VEVRILEVGNPEVIGGAIAADAYHVLHLSCHGMPGALELEDEEGRAVRATADQLVEPIRRTQRPLPLVLLNACHGGVADGQTASLAEALLRAGIPGVLAMQTSVSDFYATEFARAFYHHLASREHLLASRALAAARKELEAKRQEAARQGAPLAQTQPEYATPSLFVAGEERPLADFGREKQPLGIRPVYQVAGPVPQLRIDDLIGRRRELRDALRTLRDPSRAYAGVVLTGIGGVGKSAVAGRVMQRLTEDGWMVPAHAGRFDVASIAAAIGTELIQADRDDARKLGGLLVSKHVEDVVRLKLVAKALAEEPVLLVLDDFEQNLRTGGGEFLDPDVGKYLRMLAESAQSGRLLLTCRHPVPGAEDLLHRVPVGPLSRAETIKLLQRLDALRDCEPGEVKLVLQVIGGHPRMLEFVDALLRGGTGRLPHVTRKLREVLAQGEAKAADGADTLEEGIPAALALGARDVLLWELLDIARGEGIDEVLLQTATSNLPVSAAGVARMLAGGGDDAGDVPAATRALEQLEDLSLVHRFPDGSWWVHRWTAEGLAQLVDADEHRARHVRAGQYRWWRVQHESHSLEDAIESVRNALAGHDFDGAVGVARACFETLHQNQQIIGIATVAAEVLETLPSAHPGFATVADEEARAHLALGFTYRALARYEMLLDLQHRRLRAEPQQPGYQRDLAISYERVCNLYRALGQAEQARQAQVASFQLLERLAQAEPQRADYQHDLSVSYERSGDLYGALGQGERARQAYLASLQIRQRLAQAEPQRADYQRDLSVSYHKIGDLYRAFVGSEQARQAYLASLQVIERLAQADPQRADYQRDLAVSYIKVGDLYRDLGQGEQARQAFHTSLQIIERLAEAEPQRADYQRDLGVSYNRIGDLYEALGQDKQARQAHLASLQIIERLAQAEPQRADYQRDLVNSLVRVGAKGDDLARGRAMLRRASGILEQMQANGHLAPADEGMVEWVRGLLREMRGE